jgi:hypothetical protein
MNCFRRFNIVLICIACDRFRQMRTHVERSRTLARITTTNDRTCQICVQLFTASGIYRIVWNVIDPLLTIIGLEHVVGTFYVTIDVWGLLALLACACPLPEVRIAFVIFCQGSTGTLKIVYRYLCTAERLVQIDISDFYIIALIKKSLNRFMKVIRSMKTVRKVKICKSKMKFQLLYM